MGTSYSESLSLSDWRKTFAGHGLINHSSVNLFIYGQSVLLHMLHMLHIESCRPTSGSCCLSITVTVMAAYEQSNKDYQFRTISP